MVRLLLNKSQEKYLEKYMNKKKTTWITVSSLGLMAATVQAAPVKHPPVRRPVSSTTAQANPTAAATITLSQDPEKIQIPGNSFIEAMTTDPSSPKNLYAINTVGAHSFTLQLNRSIDGGKSWNVVSAQSSVPYSYNNRIAVSAGGNDIAVTSDIGVFVSTNQGSSFAQIGTIRDTSDLKILGNVMVVGFGGLDGSNSGARFFDKIGSSWVERDPSAQPEKLNDFEKRETDQGICGAGRQATDEGDGHCDFSTTATVHSIQIDPENPTVIYAGTGAGIMRWDPQNGWSDISKGMLSDSNVPTLQIDPATGKLLTSSCNGIYQAQVDQSNSAMDSSLISFNRIRSGAFLWEQDGPLRTSASGSLRTYDVKSNLSNPSQMVAAADTGVYLSIDGGVSWARVQTGAMDDSDLRTAHERVSEFRTVMWLSDGSAEVSGASGTYIFKP
jgi:hypothetical protein